MARVLLVDDDPTLLDLLSLALEDAGHDAVLAGDGREALDRLDGVHLVVCDVNMPRMDGFTFCRHLRGAGHGMPLLFLTSRDHEVDEALGLELGADDYVAKPFSTRVLLARVAALLRREQARGQVRADASAGSSPGVATRGHLQLDPERLELSWRGRRIEVTVTEFRLFDVLSSRPGVVWSRAQLMARVRGDDSIVVERIVDTYVRRLRRKAEAVDASFDAIETVIGAGYRWRG